MLTCEHQAFVEKALLSIFEQTVGFTLEIVIGDDCSTDETLRVIEASSCLSPFPVRLLSSDRRVGVCRNFARTFSACRGQYIAVLEGDDYWTNSQKLALAVALLEDDPSATLVGHDVDTVDPSGSRVSDTFEAPITLSAETAIERTLFRTCSLVLRRSAVAALPTPFWSLYPPDRALQILLSQAGVVRRLDGTMGSYRVHPGGVWSGLGAVSRIETNYRFFGAIRSLSDRRFRRLVDRMIYAQGRRLARALAASGSRTRGLLLALHLAVRPRLWSLEPRALLRLFLDLLRFSPSPGHR